MKLLVSFILSLSLWAAAKLPPPGVERVACLEDTRGCATALKALPRSEGVVRTFRGTVSKSGKPSVWTALPKVRAFLPHVVVTAFHETADYQALIDELIAYPSGPHVLVCLPESDAQRAAAFRKFGENNWARNVRVVESAAALLDAVRVARQKIDLDLQTEWGRYISSCGKSSCGNDLAFFYRDPIHANERGEQILGRILECYFTLDTETRN